MIDPFDIQPELVESWKGALVPILIAPAIVAALLIVTLLLNTA